MDPATQRPSLHRGEMINNLGDAKIKDAWWRSPIFEMVSRTLFLKFKQLDRTILACRIRGAPMTRGRFARKADGHEKKREQERKDKKCVKEQHRVSLDPNNFASSLSTRQNAKYEVWYHGFNDRYTTSFAEKEQVCGCLCLVKQCECYHSDPKADKSESSLRIYICVQISVPLDENSRLRYNSDLYNSVAFLSIR